MGRHGSLRYHRSQSPCVYPMRPAQSEFCAVSTGAEATQRSSKGAKPYTNLTEQLSDSFRMVTANRFLLPSAF